MSGQNLTASCELEIVGVSHKRKKGDKMATKKTTTTKTKKNKTTKKAKR